jgi:lipid II:glycine glycyltransferase (peptidoglycan interpeptide bridge formation enzyme)
LLDLRGGESALLSGMKAKCRYNIRLAERHGVRVREVSYSPQATDTFYSVLREASIRNGFVCEPAHFFDKLFRNLAEHKMATMLLAEHDGAVLACLLMVVCGERATYLYGGSRNEKRNLMAGYALQWQAIRVAIASGCKIYDFYGFDRFSNPSNPYAKFSRFKRQFGGFPVRYTGAHDHFFIDQLADSVVRALREVGASILNVER